MTNLRNKVSLHTILAIVLLCGKLSATTVVFVITPEGIIIGADSKGMGENFGGFPASSAGLIKKTAVIKDRIIVATVNLDKASIYGSHGAKLILDYDFAKWISDIEKKCAENVSVSTLANIIETEGGKTFDKLNPALSTGAFTGQNPPDPFVDYYIAGYENRMPVVLRVYFSIDNVRGRMKFPVRETIHPYPKGKPDRDFFVVGAGQNFVTAELAKGKGRTYEEFKAMVPAELFKVLAGDPLTMSEAINFCLATLRFEHKHNSERVAPPYVIKVIPTLAMGGIREMSYSR